MSFMSEAHQQWHMVNGKYSVCPLDCGVEEYAPDDYAPPNLDDAYPDEEEWEPCEHGMSLWLCAGPGHYPPDM